MDPKAGLRTNGTWLKSFYLLQTRDRAGRGQQNKIQDLLELGVKQTGEHTAAGTENKDMTKSKRK